MNTKRGISLILLVVTIVVMVIIASTIMYVSSDTTNTARMATYAYDLQQVEDLVQEYYLTNGALPEATASYTKDELLALVPNVSDILSSEISELGDDASTFYEVDLKQIGVESSERGVKKGGDATDVYVVSADNLNVYYLKGEKIGQKYYFGLTKKLTGKTTLYNDSAQNDSTIVIANSTSSIKLTKNTQAWTNLLIVNIETTLDAGESMKYFLVDQDMTSKVTGFTAQLGNVLNNDAGLKLAFNSASNLNKIFKAVKYKDGVLVADTRLKVSNLDVIVPDISNVAVTFTKYDDFTLAKISGALDLGGSGLKEARVLYTTKLDSTGSEVAYYDNLPGTITSDYVKNNGKKADFSSIKLPIDVVDFALVFIDNAGNVSLVKSASAPHDSSGSGSSGDSGEDSGGDVELSVYSISCYNCGFSTGYEYVSGYSWTWASQGFSDLDGEGYTDYTCPNCKLTSDLWEPGGYRVALDSLIEPGVEYYIL